MEIFESGEDVLVRLDPGESLMESLIRVASELHFQFALIVSGVGMVEGVELGWFCVNNNDYDRYRIAGTFDLSSISGNVAKFGDAWQPHVHLTLNRPEFETVSGHLIDCRCHITMEIGLRCMNNTQIIRTYEEGRSATFLSRQKS